MENYFENPSKHNKVLWKYLASFVEEGINPNEVDPLFSPHTEYEFLRWVLQRIKKHPREGFLNRILISIKAKESEVFIQEWYDTNRKDGYVNIVHSTAKTEHIAVYNACVNFIIKTT